MHWLRSQEPKNKKIITKSNQKQAWEKKENESFFFSFHIVNCKQKVYNVHFNFPSVVARKYTLDSKTWCSKKILLHFSFFPSCILIKIYSFIFIWLPQIWAAKFIVLGSRIVSFGQHLRYFFGQLNYLFWTANLLFWAARLIIWAAKFINGQQLFSLLNFR